MKYFVLPSKVILTGTEGIATALSYYFDSYPLFIVLYMVFQTALLCFAFWKVSRVFARRSLVVVVTVVLCLIGLPELRFAQPEPQNERIILVLFGGILAGIAKAIAFRNRGSTGDEDILGAYFAIKYLKPVGSIAIIASIGSTGFGLVMDSIKNGDFESVSEYTDVYLYIYLRVCGDPEQLLPKIQDNDVGSYHAPARFCWCRDNINIIAPNLYHPRGNRGAQPGFFQDNENHHHARRASADDCSGTGC